MYKISVLLIAAVVFYGCSSTKVSPAKDTPMVKSANNTLSEQEKNNGWKLLFDGKTIDGWHTYGKQTVGNAWKISDGALHLDPSPPQLMRNIKQEKIIGIFFIKLFFCLCKINNLFQP